VGVSLGRGLIQGLGAFRLLRQLVLLEKRGGCGVRGTLVEGVSVALCDDAGGSNQQKQKQAENLHCFGLYVINPKSDKKINFILI